MPFANFIIANSAGAVAWALFYGLGAYYLGKGVEEFARPFALALAVGRGHRGGLDDPLLAAQGTGACGCGRAGHSRTVAGGIVGKGSWVILSRIRGAPRQCRRQLLALE